MGHTDKVAFQAPSFRHVPSTTQFFFVSIIISTYTVLFLQVTKDGIRDVVITDHNNVKQPRIVFEDGIPGVCF